RQAASWRSVLIPSLGVMSGHVVKTVNKQGLMSIETGLKGLLAQPKAFSQSAEREWQGGGTALPISVGDSLSDHVSGAKGSSFAALLQSSARQTERMSAPPMTDRSSQRDDRSTSGNAARIDDTPRRPDKDQKARGQRQADDVSQS